MGYTVTERIGEDGKLHLTVPDAAPGDVVRVSIEVESVPTHKPSAFGLLRGKLKTGEDLNDPIPGMEEYM